MERLLWWEVSRMPQKHPACNVDFMLKVLLVIIFWTPWTFDYQLNSTCHYSLSLPWAPCPSSNRRSLFVQWIFIIQGAMRGMVETIELALRHNCVGRQSHLTNLWRPCHVIGLPHLMQICTSIVCIILVVFRQSRWCSRSNRIRLRCTGRDAYGALGQSSKWYTVLWEYVDAEAAYVLQCLCWVEN